MEKCVSFSIDNEEGITFEPGSDAATAVFIFECGMFWRWETERMGTSRETHSS